MPRKHSYQTRLRAFRIWQQLGYNPWAKPRTGSLQAGNPSRKGKGDFYKGAFDSIPFLNDDAKRTFTHLLLRPGYMIRDYIKGAHERYLAPLTALIVFYAFFALISAVLQPVQQRGDSEILSLEDDMEVTLVAYGLEGMDTLHYSRPFTGGALKVKRVTSSDDGNIEATTEAMILRAEVVTTVAAMEAEARRVNLAPTTEVIPAVTAER